MEIPADFAVAGLTRYVLSTALPAAEMGAWPILYRCKMLRAAV
jgi:hypothetical protein